MVLIGKTSYIRNIIWLKYQKSNPSNEVFGLLRSGKRTGSQTHWQPPYIFIERCQILPRMGQINLKIKRHEKSHYCYSKLIFKSQKQIHSKINPGFYDVLLLYV